MCFLLWRKNNQKACSKGEALVGEEAFYGDKFQNFNIVNINKH